MNKHTNKQAKETLGQYLHREREARRIALEDMPKATCISLPFIMALENDDFAFFSQQQVIPGYLKLYTRHLGLDYDEVLKRYHIQSELDNHTKAFQQLPLLLDDYAFPIKPAKDNKQPDYRRFIGIVVPGVAAVACVWFALYLYMLAGQTKDIDVNAPPPPVNTVNIVQQAPATTEIVVAPPDLQQKPDLAPLPLEPEKSGQPQKPALVVAPDQANRLKAENTHPETLGPAAKINTAKVIGNSDSKHYHLPGMQYYSMVKAYHRVEFALEEDAIKAGYHKADN